jgi:hypothetical protein
MADDTVAYLEQEVDAPAHNGSLPWRWVAASGRCPAPGSYRRPSRSAAASDLADGPLGRGVTSVCIGHLRHGGSAF